MKNKGAVLFWTDIANAVAFAGLLATGVIIKWVLPHGGHGQGGGRAGLATWAGISRHEWSDIHFWFALAAVVLVILHLAMHMGWIVAAGRKYLLGWLTPPRAAAN